MTNNINNNNAARPLEGLGGPIHVADHRPLAQQMIDPTLDSCCQREMEDNLRAGALRQTLQRHDVVAERERRRRNLVNAPGFQGCRCLYDPQTDGGDYTALLVLKSQRSIAQSRISSDDDDDNDIVKKIGYCVDIEKGETKEGPEEKDNESEDDEFDYLLDEDLPGQELVAIEDQRRAELEMELLQRETELQHGYGTHRQMHPTRVLKAAGLAADPRKQDNVVPFCMVHLFDPDSETCASLDLYLEELATTMRGTKFLRSEGLRTLQLNASLVQNVLPKLRAERDLPVLIAIRDGVVVATCPQLELFCTTGGHRKGQGQGQEHVVTHAVYDWLHRLDMLHEHPPALELLCRIRPEEQVLLDHLAREAALAKKGAAPEYYRCGVPNCQKTFFHQHVGVQTSEQSGLVVPESQIVGGET